MKKVLVSAGCSYAYGYMLQDRSDRYSNIIAKKYGLGLIDLGAAGVANETIASFAIAGVNRALEMYKPEEITLLVGWTSQGRMEYFRKKIDTVLAWLVAGHTTNPSTLNMLTDDISAFDILNAAWTPGFGYYRFLSAFNSVNTHCKYYGVDIVNRQSMTMLPVAMPEGAAEGKHRATSQTIFNKYLLSRDCKDALKELQDTSVFRDIVLPSNELDNTNHPTKEGHQRWAEILMKDHHNKLC
jgi:hypothetical protein